MPKQRHYKFWKQVDARRKASASTSVQQEASDTLVGVVEKHDNRSHDPPMATSSELAAHAARMASEEQAGHILLGEGWTLDEETGALLYPGGGGTSSFFGLTEVTPDDFAGAGGGSFLVRVNVAGDALEFVDGLTLFAADDHDHSGVYLTQAEADLLYAAIDHNHNGVYSPVGHTHTGVYSPVGHTHAFITLTDVPSSYSGQGSKLVRVNSGASALEFVDGSTLYASVSHNHDGSYSALGHTHGVSTGGTGLTSIAADQMLYSSASNTLTTTPLTAFARGLLDDTDAATMRTTLGLVSGGAGDVWVLRAGDTMTGDLTISKANAALTVTATSGGSGANLNVRADTGNANLNFDSTGTTQSQLNFRKMISGSPSLRWVWVLSATAESGSNAGSNLGLLRRQDSGASLGNPVFAIERATGFIGINLAEATATYTLDVNGTFNIQASTGGIVTLTRADATVTSGESLGMVEWRTTDGDVTTSKVGANIEVLARQAYTTDFAAGALVIRVTPASGGTKTPVEVARFHSDQIGFFGVTPVSRSTGWTITAGYTPDKAFNPESTTTLESARVLATLIDYFITRGDLGT